MKKKFLLLLVAIATCCITASAADSYEINVAGVEVTPNNCNYITGGGIESGYGVYDKSSNTLTLHGVSINVKSLNNFGIHNRKCDNLKIVFSGNCYVIAADNAMKLERSTTISVASGNSATLYSGNRIVVNLKSYDYYFTGSGTINVLAEGSAYEAIKGEGTSSTKVYFQGPKISASSDQRSALSSFAAYFQSGSDLTIRGNGSDASVSGVSMSFYGNETVLEPYGAYYSNNSIYSSSGSQIKSGTIRISDNYVALINSSNFPDANFRSFMLGEYSKGYITSTDVDSRKSLSPSGKSISNLQGIGYFTKLTTLNCSGNNLSSLDLSAQTELKTLNASSNQLTSINLPVSLETLNLSNNTKFTTFNWCYKNALKIVDFSNCTGVKTVSLYNNSAMTSLSMSNCTALTTLNCYTSALTYINVSGCSALTTLNCYSNQLTSLGTLPNSLQTLNCSSNQLTSLSTLPTSLQTLNCSSNKLSGTFTLTNRSALKTLNISNNPNLTTLYCGYNSLTSLNVTNCSQLTEIDCTYNNLNSSFDLTGCTSLRKLNCNTNKLTSLLNVPNSLVTLFCQDNSFTNLSITSKSSLSVLDVRSNRAMTSLYCNNNVLTNLLVEDCSALKTLYCNGNKLTALSLSGCSALQTLYMIMNQVSGSNMTNLISSLRTIPTSEAEGILYVINQTSNEGNAITDAQIKSARAKRWIPKKYQNNEWVWATIRGDVNGDGVCNAADVTALYNWILNNDASALKNGYQNDDNVVNAGDVTTVYNVILGY